MKKILLIFLIFTISYSCKKEHLPIEVNQTGLLARILIDDKPYMEFTYTASGLINERKSWGSYSKYSYNYQDQLVKAEHYSDPALVSSNSHVIEEAQKRKEWANPNNVPKSITNTFSYSKDGKFADGNFDGANGYQSSAKYEINEKGLVLKDIFYNEGKPSGYLEYQYDEQGNLIRKKHYFISADGTTKLSNETEYEYDDKKNPFLPFRRSLNPGQYTNQNNITKETYTLYGEIPKGVERVQITTHTYNYNKSGYPTKVNGATVYEYY